MRYTSTCLTLSAALATLVGVAETTAAAQTTITISMTPAPPAPKIQGPAVVATRPGTPFLHTISATGTPRPTYTATGLPAGLTLDATTGQIGGSVATAGSYPVSITATSGAGSDTRPLTIVAGNQLALTPPMGWNSYDSYSDTVTEAQVVANARVIQSALQPLGWDYVVVDFRWYDPNAGSSNQNGTNPQLTLDAMGRLQPAPNRFPSAGGAMGFKPLADQVHAMGLKFGIHIMRGIPRLAVQNGSAILGSTFHAADAADTTSICPWNSDMYGVQDTAAGQAWWNSIISQYAGWGVDFLKVDDMVRNVAPVTYHLSEVAQVQRAIAQSGRSIVLSLSPGETPVSASAHLQANANMWRMSNDFWDNWAALDHTFVLGEAWQPIVGPGHWPDADMLPLGGLVGSLGPHCPVNGANRATAFTHNEQVLLMSLWAVLPSPLVLGTNATQLAGDPWTTALLSNDEVLAISQDSLGSRAKLVVRNGTTEVWARDLAGGRKAVGLFNRGTADAAVSATFAQLGVSGTLLVRDVWHRQDVAGAQSGVTMNVAGHGAVLLTVSPPGSVTGGDDGGAALDAGVLVTEGGGAAVSDAGDSGPAPTDGGRPGAVETGDGATGPAEVDGSSPDAATVDGSAVAKASSKSGCGCSTAVGSRSRSLPSWMAWAALGLVVLRRSRAPRRETPRDG